MTEYVDSTQAALPLPETQAPPTEAKPETPKLKSPERLVIFAALLGFAVDYFFYDKSLGLSFPLFIALAALVLVAVALLERVRPSLSSIWLALPMLGLAYMVYVRAEPLTTFVNVTVALALGILWARTFGNGQLLHFGLFDILINYLAAGVEAILRPWPVLADSAKGAASTQGRRNLLLPILRGLLIAAPLLCIFTVLLTSADLIFADRFQNLLKTFNLDNLPELFVRTVLVGLAAFAALGLLIQALRPLRYALIGANGDLFPRVIGLVESSIVLGSINVLFAAFVLIQFRYLFGGTSNIVETGFTFSDYARRGFGELTLVVFFSLLILLALSAVVRRETQGRIVTFNIFNLLMVGLVGIVAASALARLLLYEQAYGFSRLRTYSHVAIIWLGLLFVPYLVALLAGRLRWFAPGAILCVIGFAATLNGLNVDHFIAQQNIARRTNSYELHARYLVTLSDDAMPDLVALYKQGDSVITADLGPGLACRAQQFNDEAAQSGWQSYQQSHDAARAALVGLDVLTHYPVTKDAYNQNAVTILGATVECNEILQSYVLEPGVVRDDDSSP